MVRRAVHGRPPPTPGWIWRSGRIPALPYPPLLRVHCTSRQTGPKAINSGGLGQSPQPGKCFFRMRNAFNLVPRFRADTTPRVFGNSGSDAAARGCGIGLYCFRIVAIAPPCVHDSAEIPTYSPVRKLESNINIGKNLFKPQRDHGINLRRAAGREVIGRQRHTG